MNKQQLLHALETVRPGLSDKEKIEQSTSFAFINGKIISYNDEISISHPFEELNIEGAVKAEEFYKFVSKLPGDEFEISTKGNEIIVKSGRSTAGLTLQQKIVLPLEEIGEIKGWKSLPEDFIEGISFVMTSCSREMTKPILTCVHINSEGFVEASDEYRITRYNTKNIPFTFLIPASTVIDLVKLNPIKIAKGKGWVHFQTEENTIISCRVFEEAFPDTSPFLEVEGIKITFPESVIEVLERASIFAKRESALMEDVDITLEKNRLRIHSKSETGWFKEEVNIRYDDTPVTFHITPYLLRSIFSETLICTLAKDRLKFQGDNWIYITLLRGEIK